MTDEQIARCGTTRSTRCAAGSSPRRTVAGRAAVPLQRAAGGGARLALVVGYGMTEDREQEPPITNPHGFSVAWLGALPERAC
jgi:hypothetical protein